MKAPDSGESDQEVEELEEDEEREEGAAGAGAGVVPPALVVRGPSFKRSPSLRRSFRRAPAAAAVAPATEASTSSASVGLIASVFEPEERGDIDEGPVPAAVVAEAAAGAWGDDGDDDSPTLFLAPAGSISPGFAGVLDPARGDSPALFLAPTPQGPGSSPAAGFASVVPAAALQAPAPAVWAPLDLSDMGSLSDREGRGGGPAPASPAPQPPSVESRAWHGAAPASLAPPDSLGELESAAWGADPPAARAGGGPAPSILRRRPSAGLGAGAHSPDGSPAARQAAGRRVSVNPRSAGSSDESTAEAAREAPRAPEEGAPPGLEPKPPKPKSMEDLEGREGEEGGGGEAEKAVAQKAGLIFRTMVARYLVALMVLGVLGCTQYVVSCALVSRASQAGSIIRLAGSRRYLVRDITFVCREVFVDDGVVGFTKADAVTRLVDGIQRLREAHTQLKYGTGYSQQPQQVELLYGGPCLRADGDCSPATLDYLAPLVSRGLDFCVEQYIGFAQEALKANRAFTKTGTVNTAAPFFADRTPHPIDPAELGAGPCCDSATTILPASEAMRAVYDLHELYLDAGLAASQRLYLDAAGADIGSALKFAAVVFAIQMAACLGAFVLVFRPIIRQLREECGRSDELLHMLPKEMMPLLRELQRFIRGANARAGDGGRGALREALDSLRDIAEVVFGLRARPQSRPPSGAPHGPHQHGPHPPAP